MHLFNRADGGDPEHDHPWDFSSLILSKGYVEEHSGGKLRKRGFLSFKSFMAEHSHRILSLNGKWCLTLAWIGKRKRVWGYNTKEGWVNHLGFRKKKGLK